jgi:acetyl-CoA carboxylase biotin carboxyl carrier protein
MPIQDDDIRWLLALVEQEDLAEIEVHEGGSEIVVRRHLPAPSSAVVVATEAEVAPVLETAPVLPDNVVPIVAPMAGVFYRAPSPQSPPYVEVGQAVEEGDVVGLIEAMKLFNDVTSPVSGTVYQVLVQNAEQVEAGRPLMLIET